MSATLSIIDDPCLAEGAVGVLDLASPATATLVQPTLPPRRPGRKLSICLINPRFEPSYWGFDFALPLYPGDKRSTMISGSLSALAGLCGGHDVTLVDENVEEIDSALAVAFVSILAITPSPTHFVSDSSGGVPRPCSGRKTVHGACSRTCRRMPVRRPRA